MNRSNCLAALLTIPTLVLGSIELGSNRANAANIVAANTVRVSCDTNTSVPTVVATLSTQDSASTQDYRSSQTNPILSFLPEYFSPESALTNCQKTAQSLHKHYSQGEMNYLASDTINGKPVVCAVKRRGVRCDNYSSEILFSIDKTVNPTQLLYNMLGNNFKGSQPPSLRTVSRIYTDLRPNWWPF